MYLGVRGIFYMDKLLPGTAYCLRVQAINADVRTHRGIWGGAF